MKAEKKYNLINENVKEYSIKLSYDIREKQSKK